jgi:hypothetical protein
LHILRNDGGNRNHSLKVDIHGHVSNRSAVEAKVEMRAGSLYQKIELYSASPAPAPSDLIFGLGKREKPDALRVLWPAGIVQAETEFPSPSSSGLISLNVTEIDRKPRRVRTCMHGTEAIRIHHRFHGRGRDGISRKSWSLQHT